LRRSPTRRLVQPKNSGEQDRCTRFVELASVSRSEVSSSPSRGSHAALYVLEFVKLKTIGRGDGSYDFLKSETKPNQL
jgi:hypothetical protein